MSEQKTRPADQSVADFIASIPDEQRRAGAQQLVDLLARASGEEPRLWTGGMVGFGQYHYKYASGHEGDTSYTGFAPRKNALTVYFLDYLEQTFPEHLARLGKYKMGKGCLYIKKLADVDTAVLEDMVRQSVQRIRQRQAEQG